MFFMLDRCPAFKIYFYFLGNIEKCPFTYWLYGRWFLQKVDIGNLNMKLNGRWFPQIVDRDSGNLYPIYIYKKLVLASEPVGGRSRATELPCFIVNDMCIPNSQLQPFSSVIDNICIIKICIAVLCPTHTDST